MKATSGPVIDLSGFSNDVKTGILQLLDTLKSKPAKSANIFNTGASIEEIRILRKDRLRAIWSNGAFFYVGNSGPYYPIYWVPEFGADLRTVFLAPRWKCGLCVGIPPPPRLQLFRVGRLVDIVVSIDPFKNRRKESKIYLPFPERAFRYEWINLLSRELTRLKAM